MRRIVITLEVGEDFAPEDMDELYDKVNEFGINVQIKEEEIKT